MTRADRSCRIAPYLLVAGLALLSQSANAVDGAKSPMPVVDAAKELVLEVDVNRQGLKDATIIMQRGTGELLASADDLRRWRLRIPDAAAETHGGIAYYPLQSIAGLTYQMDQATQTLAISAPPDAFDVSDFSAAPSRIPKPTVPTLGGYFNYDLQVTNGGGVTQEAGLFEGAVFGSYGVLIGNFLGQTGANQNKATRLNTTFTHDEPAAMTSLRIGDALTAPGAWGRSVNFGGVQYATNFATQPAFITTPLLAAQGTAALPSAVDIYVNNILAAHREVAPGPFDVNNLPPITGQGQVRVVVTDLLGRQQSVVQPFYSSTDLLAAGLQDFSYSAGALRKNFGIESNDYGPWFGQASYRRGLTNSLTGELRAEVSQGQQVTLGGAASFLLPGLFGEVNVGGAGSHNDHGNGALALLGYQVQGSVLSLGFQGQWTTPEFTQLGADATFPVPRLLTSAFAGLNMGQYGSLTASYVLLDPRRNAEIVPGVEVRPRMEVGTVGYTLGIFDRATLSVNFSSALSGERTRQLSVSVIIPIDAQTSASGTFNKVTGKSNEQDFTAQVQRNLPLGDGYGYRILATDRGNAQAGGTIQTDYGIYSAEAARFQGTMSYRAGVAGGIGTVGGRAFVSRPITDSFALVDVADYANVQVYQDNQPVGRTRSDGLLLLTRLRSYDTNPIRIDPLDLAFDAQIDSLALNIVPYYRSGVYAAFEVRRSNGALLKVVREDGKPLPAGSILKIDGIAQEFPVGMDGGAYLTDLGATNRVRSQAGGRPCAFDLPFQLSTDPLPNLGTFVCRATLQ